MPPTTISVGSMSWNGANPIAPSCETPAAIIVISAGHQRLAEEGRHPAPVQDVEHPVHQHRRAERDRDQHERRREGQRRPGRDPAAAEGREPGGVRRPGQRDLLVLRGRLLDPQPVLDPGEQPVEVADLRVVDDQRLHDPGHGQRRLGRAAVVGERDRGVGQVDVDAGEAERAGDAEHLHDDVVGRHPGGEQVLADPHHQVEHRHRGDPQEPPGLRPPALARRHPSIVTGPPEGRATRPGCGRSPHQRPRFGGRGARAAPEIEVPGARAPSLETPHQCRAGATSPVGAPLRSSREVRTLPTECTAPSEGRAQ